MDNSSIDSCCDPPADSHTGWNDILGTWRLCRKRICQRRKRCCGERYACLRATLPLLPDSVKDWFGTLIDCRFSGVEFDDAMAALKGSWEEQGYIAWRAAIGQPVTAPNGEKVDAVRAVRR
jgi:hypothetical protein